VRTKLRRLVQKKSARGTGNKEVVQRNQDLEPAPDRQLQDRRREHFRPYMDMDNGIRRIVPGQFAIQGAPRAVIPKTAGEGPQTIRILDDLRLAQTNDAQPIHLQQRRIDRFRGGKVGGRYPARRQSACGGNGHETPSTADIGVVVEDEDTHGQAGRPPSARIRLLEIHPTVRLRAR